MILIIDNFDSFTYNLYQYVGSINPQVAVYRNNAITLEGIRKLNPSHIIISPGPGQPKDAGVCEAAINKLKGMYPMLGVCLGHQAIGEVFGGKVVLAPKLVHGKTSKIKIDTTCKLFSNMPKEIQGARYHSLIVAKKNLPKELLITAETEQGEIMGLKHKDYNIYGVQFHPESIMTPDGKKIIENFLKITGGK
jgi:anthranilate synthase component 2